MGEFRRTQFENAHLGGAFKYSTDRVKNQTAPKANKTTLFRLEGNTTLALIHRPKKANLLTQAQLATANHKLLHFIQNIFSKLRPSDDFRYTKRNSP